MKKLEDSVPFKLIIMKKIKNLILFLIVGVSFSSCVGIYEDGAEIANDIKCAEKQISVADLKQKIENGDDFTLIDVRQPDEYYTSNIPGSILLPRGILESKIGDEEFWMSQYIYPPDKDSSEIIIYCKSEKRGILAVHSLSKLGYKKVKNLEGGYDAFNPNQDPNAKPKKSSGGCGG